MIFFPCILFSQTRISNPITKRNVQKHLLDSIWLHPSKPRRIRQASRTSDLTELVPRSGVLLTVSACLSYLLSGSNAALDTLQSTWPWIGTTLIPSSCWCQPYLLRLHSDTIYPLKPPTSLESTFCCAENSQVGSCELTCFPSLGGKSWKEKLCSAFFFFTLRQMSKERTVTSKYFCTNMILCWFF